MQLSDRKNRILKAVVEEHIRTAQPVSSKALQVSAFAQISSATIRNELNELEHMGLLEQPHTSAGRVPTALGYRIYVNALMDGDGLSDLEANAITETFEKPPDLPEELMAEASRLANYVTALPSWVTPPQGGGVTAARYELVYIDNYTFIIVVMLSNKSVQNRLVTLPSPTSREMLTKLSSLFNASFTGIGEEDVTTERITATERAAGDHTGLVAVISGFVIEILMKAKTAHTVVSGTTSLLKHPEFQDVQKAERVFEYLANEQELMRLPLPEQGVKILIGPENVSEALSDSTVMVAKYDVGDNLTGLIGVVGPTRMDYAKIAAKLQYIANGLAKALTLGERDGS